MIVPHQMAYIDPSQISYIGASIGAIVVAVGGFAAIYWRKAKKKVQDKLNIEDKSVTETEEAVTLKETNEK